MGAASATPVEERGPAALLPAPAARMAGFALLAAVGALEWRRMVDGLGAGRPLLWVIVAVAAAAGVLGASRLRPRWRAPATLGTAVVGLLGAYATAGPELRLLKPRRWAELADGLGSGAQALSSVKLPYEGVDPWPGLTLQLLGALLVVIAGLLAFWPREGSRGYPFVSLVALLTLVAVPVVSLGGTRSILLGAVVAALVVAFLWLERLPLRPGLGVAALLGLALTGGVPLATMADREEPWFDYKAFAEGLGPDDPVRFNWEHSDYGPIDWPRDGSEVMRVKSDDPLYWKMRTLDDFSGDVWLDSQPREVFGEAQDDLPYDWQERPGDRERIQVSIRRMRSVDVPGAGTILDVRDSTRPVRPSGRPGEWMATGELQRGDSYTAVVHVPRPTPEDLAEARTGADSRHLDELTARVEIQRGGGGIPITPLGETPRFADIEFLPFEWSAVPAASAELPAVAVSMDGDAVLKRSAYRRTWRLAKRLRRASQTPFEYVQRVNAYLHRSEFVYSETPPAPAPGQAPLEAFLFDTRSGYCQAYSGAMALLLRMAGIPTRVATGFSAGGFSDRKQAWIVRDTDAHSWVEAWFDDYGWVAFDPTPAATPARSQIAALSPTEDPQESDDASAAGAAADDTDPAQDRAALNAGPRGSATDTGAAATGDAGGGLPTWFLLLGVAAALVAGTVSLLVLRARKKPLSADRAIRELLVALRRSGRPAPPGATLTELERRLGLSGDAAAYVRAIRADRYAAKAQPPQPGHRRALRRALARGLGPTGRLRALWALPPRLR